MSPLTSPSPVSRELIRLDARAQDKTNAIAQVAQMLVAAGCVAPGYEASMGRREAWLTTWLCRSACWMSIGFSPRIAMAWNRVLVYA